MAIIYNSEVTKAIVDTGKLSTSRDKIPNELAEKVLPVMEINPRLLRDAKVLVAYNRTTTANPTNPYTCPAGYTTYITNIIVTRSQDATCDNTSTRLQAVINGATVNLIMLRKATTTVINDCNSFVYSLPVKIDAASSLSFTHTFTAGTSTTDVIVYGYEVPNN